MNQPVETTKGQVFVEKATGAERFVPHDQLENFVASGRYAPKSGKVNVFVPDGNGNLVPRQMTVEAYNLSQKVGGGSARYKLQGDEDAAIVEQARQDGHAQMQAEFDERQGGTAFAVNAAPFSATIGRQFLKGDLKKEAGDDFARLNQANPVESMAGVAAQAILTTALTGGAVGLARTGMAAVKAGGAAEAMFAAANTMKASKLLGFADAAGNYATGALIRGGGNKLAASIIGRGVSSALLSAPAATVYEAAHRADTDIPFTAESFITDVGIDIALGAAFDFGIPLLGAAAKTVGKTAVKVGTTGGRAAMSLGGLLKGASAIKFLKGDGDPLMKAMVFEKAFMRTGNKNAASRAVAGKALKDAGEQAVTRGQVVDMLRPTKLTTAKDVAKFEEHLSAAMGSGAVDPTDIVRAADGLEGMAGLHKAMAYVETAANQTVEVLDGHLGNMAYTGKYVSAGDLRVEIAMEASMMKNAMEGMDVPKAYYKEAERMVGFGPGIPRKEAIARAMNFRNRAVFDAANGAVDPTVAKVVTDHIDTVLARADVMGEGVGTVADIFAAADNIAKNKHVFKGLAKQSKELDSMVDLEGIGALGVLTDEMADAYQTLATVGAVSKKDARYVMTRMNAVRGQLEKHSPHLDGVVALNKVRNQLAGEADTVLHMPGAGTAADQVTAASVEANVSFATRVNNMVERYVAKPDTGIGYRAGIYKFRSMKTYEEKKASYDQAVAALREATASPEQTIRTVSNFTQNLVNDPALASTIAQKSVQRYQYMAMQIPMSPRGMIPSQVDHASPAEVATFMEQLGASDDPISVMASAFEGTLNGSALAVIETIFPVATAEMRIEVAQIMQTPETYEKLSFKQRLSLDTFLGGGWEPAAQPGAVMRLQSRAAQTQAQERAQRGSGAPKQQYPENSPQSSNSDRLSNL